MKHTKWPWYLDEHGNLKSDSSKSTRNMVAFHGVCISDSDEAKANTQLISTITQDLLEERDNLKAVNADLLEALKEVVRTLESDAVSICDTIWVSNGSPETLYDYCRAAIAKAEGL